MRDVVCAYGQTQIDALRMGLRQIYKKLHCSFSYNAALELGKEKNEQDEFEQGMEAAQAKAQEIREFCFDGCKCGPTESEKSGFTCGDK